MEAVMRGAAGAMFARDQVSHPLLLLMPYGSDAPKHLRQLEATVVMALDQKENEESRTAAALSLRSIVYQPCMRIPDHGLLLIEVLRCLTSELSRPVLLEELAIAYLARDGIRIETGCCVDPAGAPLPRLLRDELLQPLATVVEHVGHFDEALKIWSDVADKLLWLDLQQVRSMSLEDICACVRMFILYLMHTPGPELGNGQAHRLELFQSTGLSVWNLLLERLKELSSLDPDLEEQFGDDAQRALWHRLRGDWLLKQKVQAPVERAVCKSLRTGSSTTVWRLHSRWHR